MAVLYDLAGLSTCCLCGGILQVKLAGGGKHPGKHYIHVCGLLYQFHFSILKYLPCFRGSHEILRQSRYSHEQPSVFAAADDRFQVPDALSLAEFNRNFEVVCSSLELNVHAMPKTTKKAPRIVTNEKIKTVKAAKLSKVVETELVESENPLVREPNPRTRTN